MSGADIPAAASDAPAAVRTFSRGGEDEPDARDDDSDSRGSSGDRPDDQLERQCGEWCVPLDELDNNDTSASDVEYFKTVVWTAAMGTAVDAVLAVVKFAAGFAFASSALVADAVHSTSDVVSDLVVIAAARYASAPPDARYPYGRGRWEAVATLFVSVALVWAASTLIVEFAERLAAAYGPLVRHLRDLGVAPRSRLPGTRNALLEVTSNGGVASSTSLLDDVAVAMRTEDPTDSSHFRLATEEDEEEGKTVAGAMDSAAVLVALLSVVVKEAAFQLTHRVADRIGSKVLAANAWHHRSDAPPAALGRAAPRPGPCGRTPPRGSPSPCWSQGWVGDRQGRDDGARRRERRGRGGGGGGRGGGVGGARDGAEEPARRGSSREARGTKSARGLLGGAGPGVAGERSGRVAANGGAPGRGEAEIG